MTTSNTPPISPEVQSQTPIPEGDTTTVSSSKDSGRRQWVEPAVVVAAITLAVTILALLVAIVFGIYGMNARMDMLADRMDVLNADLNARMDALAADLGARMDTLAADLNARMDTLSSRMDVLSDRMDTLAADLNARMDALSSRMDNLAADLSARIDNLYQLLFSKESLENIKNGPLQAPDLQS